MIRFAVKIAYLGEHYAGSQIQPGYRTVEGDVLSALQLILKMTQDDLDLHLASRTDKGVNALGNVAVFNSCIEDPDVLLKALNAVSKGVFYRSITPVDEGFNPRYANVRQYRYILPSFGMNLAAMKDCAALFVGEHDLARFCKYDGKPTVITLDSVDVRKEGDLIVIDFSARYYLWNMIRRIVAAMMSVGRGDSEISDIQKALDGEDITFGLARPDALTLLDVRYDGLEFIVTSQDMFDNRVREEMFRNSLKELFFTSL